MSKQSSELLLELESHPHRYHAGAPYQFPSEDLRRLSQISNFKAARAILIDWTIVVAFIWVTQRNWNLGLYLLSIAVIGGRQHSFWILAHDASHFRLFTNKKIND